MWKNVVIFILACSLCISIVFNTSHHCKYPKGTQTKHIENVIKPVIHYTNIFKNVDYVVYTGNEQLKQYLKTYGARDEQFTTTQHFDTSGIYFVCLEDSFSFNQKVGEIDNNMGIILEYNIEWSHIIFNGNVSDITSTWFEPLSTGNVGHIDVYLYNNRVDNKKFVYTNLFTNVKPYSKPVCLAMIEGCQKRESYAQKQCEHLSSMDNIESFYVVGDESLTDIKIDLTKRKVTVPCKDNYINLCQKSYYLYKVFNMLTKSNPNFENVRCVLKTDDDIDIRDNLAEWMKPYMDKHMYWGKVNFKNAHASNHFFKRAKISQSFHDELTNIYPHLLKYKVWVDTVDYTNGGCTFVHKNAISHILDNHDLFKEMPEYSLLDSSVVNGFLVDLPAFEDVSVGTALSRANIHPQHVDILSVFHWDGIH